jgi:hypothetical protein
MCSTVTAEQVLIDGSVERVLTVMMVQWVC